MAYYHERLFSLFRDRLFLYKSITSSFSSCNIYVDNDIILFYEAMILNLASHSNEGSQIDSHTFSLLFLKHT